MASPFWFSVVALDLGQRNIGDFRRRKDYDAYQQATGSCAT
jgi:hypothetical protein